MSTAAVLSGSAGEIVLSAEHLTKRFGSREAVADVSFDVRAGEVFGFLGPNGAGKTTTIRMLVGLARPDRGRVRIRGLDLARDFEKAMGHVGCIVEAPDLYKYLTGRENLLHFSRMLPAGAARADPGARAPRGALASGWTTRSRPTRSACASASASRRRCSAIRTS